MNTPAESPTPSSRARPGSTKSPARRIAAVVIVGVLTVAVLWIAAFSFITSLLIGSGVVVVIVAADAVSDVVSMILEAVASAIFLVLAGIAAVFAAIFSVFG